jgi:Zn-dependent peptidase ImmA (M78 family)
VRNKLLSSATASDIDGQIDKVLRGLGNPEPPLRLEEVRELLKLDRQFYTTSDTGIMAETLSRLRVASKQIVQRPTLILDAIKKWDFRAFYLPDRKRILIDSTVPTAKHRWIEGHEITHSLLPWHAELMLGDTEQTLSPVCHDHLEGEANYGAGQLLFMRSRFVTQARDMPLAIDTVQTLSKTFGNTLTSTLWRLIETVHAQTCAFGAVTCHPHPSRRPANFNPADPCRYFIRSPKFAREFAHVGEVEVFTSIASYCAPRRGGPLGDAEIVMVDSNGQPHDFTFHTFYNGYEALTLGSHLRPRPTVVRPGTVQARTVIGAPGIKV